MRKFHHMGIPTDKPLRDERHLAHLKMYVSGYEDSHYNIEWMRFEPDAPYPEIVKTLPHLAFEVDNLEAALKIIQPNSPSSGLEVAFIEDNGAPIELMQIDHAVFEDKT